MMSCPTIHQEGLVDRRTGFEVTAMVSMASAARMHRLVHAAKGSHDPSAVCSNEPEGGESGRDLASVHAGAVWPRWST